MQLCKRMRIHLIDYRTRRQPAMDNVYRRLREFPRNMRTIALPAARIFSTRKHRHLLLLVFHIIFFCDSTSQSIDILIFGFLQKVFILSVMFNHQISITHLSRRPDGVMPQIIFYKTEELFLANPHQESKHVNRASLAKLTEISFFPLRARSEE